MLLSGTLTKAHIIEAIIQYSVYTPKKSSEAAEILLEPVKSILKNGEYILIPKFDKYCVKKKGTERQKPDHRQRPDQ